MPLAATPLEAVDLGFYTTFAKIDDAALLVLAFLGAVAVLLRVRKNGLLSTLAAVAGLAFIGLADLYWLLQDFEVITGSNEFVWAASRIVFDLGIVLLIAALVLPRVGATGPKPPAVPPVGAWPGQPVPPQAQPPAFGAYAPPPAPTSPPAGWPQTPPQQ
ncbi:hypothetical protein AB0M47_05790 [Hamadaea sp. NPDC051192]|uniref:hypothetical protein n=1 Tax=Hamadaea sp. NPDC051192 TaxID=3154940 RepID=UPI00342E1C00